MAEFLKQAAAEPPSGERVKRDVSDMLLAIERRGEAAVRELSRRFDDWDPPRFTVGEADVRSAGRALSDELQEHIAFAQGRYEASPSGSGRR